MHKPGSTPGRWRTVQVIVLVAIALLANSISAQRSSPRSADGVAQTPPATGTTPSTAEPFNAAVPQTEVLQVPLRRAGDGLIIHTEDGLISLAARGASVTDVLTALAELQGLNVITQETVTGTLNTTLNHVPIQDALDVILEMTGHTWTRQKNIILVTSVAQASTLSPGSQGRQVEVFALDFVAATDVNTVVANMLSPVGTVSVVESAIDDNRRTQELLIVEDIPRYLATIRNYVRQHDVPPRQVMVEAYILQVDLTDDMRHGVNFDHLFDLSSNMFQLEGRGFGSATASQGFFVNLSGGNLTAMIEMLETATDAKTLASPKIRVLNGQTARLQVGEQLGFRVTTVTETAATETVQFLDVGVVLEVTPRIASDGTVIMRVQPEVSSGQVNAATGLPQEETTELQTDVMFRDNQAFVIGGLIQEVDSDTQGKIPWLGDWRHIGRIFQRREVNKRRTEIIIALLPRVMPFDPLTHQRYQIETERATTPLLQGPLHEYPRPWEPQLPDAVDNPPVYPPPPWVHWGRRKSAHTKGGDSDGLPVPEPPVPSPEQIFSPNTYYTSRRPHRTPPTGALRMTRLPSISAAPTRQDSILLLPSATMLR